MFGTALDKASGYLNQRFVLVAFFPTVVFSAGWLALVASGSGWGRAIRWWQGLLRDEQALVVVGAIGGLVFCATLLSVHTVAITKLHEGYWGSGSLGRALAWPGTRFHRRRLRRLDPLHSERDYEYRYRNYPRQQDDVLPTRLGNVLRAAEEYPSDSGRYGIDAVFFWPRLYAVLPDSFRADLDDARSAMDFMLVVSTLGWLFAIGAAVFLGVSGGVWIAWLAAVAAPALLAQLSYRGSIRAADLYGDLVRSAYDLFRGSLLRQLGYAAPVSLDDERKIWVNLGQLLYRRAASEPSVLRYASVAVANAGEMAPSGDGPS